MAEDKINEKRESMNWIPVIELAVLAFTTLGTTIVLFLHSDSKMEEGRRRTDTLVDSIRQDIKQTGESIKESNQRWLQESKDFHGRLCAIEERNREK